MITEKHLNHILKEMEYTLLSIVREITKDELQKDVIDLTNTQPSIKYLKEKIGLMKFYIDWIRVDIEEDRPS